jgi:hypothetical protein
MLLTLIMDGTGIGILDSGTRTTSIIPMPLLTGLTEPTLKPDTLINLTDMDIMDMIIMTIMTTMNNKTLLTMPPPSTLSTTETTKLRLPLPQLLFPGL